MSRLTRGNHFLGGFASDNYLEDYNMDKDIHKNPVTNISENKDRYKIELGIPGFRKEELKLTVKDNNLVVTGIRKKGRDEKKVEDEYWQQEFNYSTFERSFHLPDNINTDEIAAKCEYGILEILLPKNEKSLHSPSVIQIR